METLQTLLYGLGIIGVYFLPFIVASVRKHRQLAPILLTNLLLGWTVIGWIAALIWAVASFNKEGAPA